MEHLCKLAKYYAEEADRLACEALRTRDVSAFNAVHEYVDYALEICELKEHMAEGGDGHEKHDRREKHDGHDRHDKKDSLFEGM